MGQRTNQTVLRRNRCVTALVIAILMMAPLSGVFAAAPTAIGDLQLSPPVDAPQLHMILTWKAPAAAASYNIRYSTSAITNTNFASAANANVRTLTGSVANPSSAGTLETVEILGLAPNTTYYFAIKSSDSAGNASGLSNVPTRTTAKYEGYGHAAVGGGTLGGAICRVTTLADTGAGSLRTCLNNHSSGSPTTVVFNVASGGNITLGSDILLTDSKSNLTIDGSTAPSPGITFRKPSCPAGTTTCPIGDGCIANGEFMVGADSANPTHDVILTHLRWQGNYAQGWGDCLDNSSATLGLQYNFHNIVVDHVTVRNSEDAGPDMWTGDRDSHSVTLSNSIIGWSNHPLLLKGTGEGGANGSRDDISIHHNVFARSGQRMPAIVARSTDIDFRNNVVFDWASSWTGRSSGDGMQILQQGGFTPTINIVNNYFLAGSNGTNKPRLALFYGDRDGGDAVDGGPSGCTTQGQVVTTGTIGEIWTAGNTFPTANCDRFSTVSAERAVPAADKVTTDSASALMTSVLAGAGAHFRTADETAMMIEIAVQMGCGNGARVTGEQCDGADLGGKKCQDLGYTGGTLSCTSFCTFNTLTCTVSGLSPSQVLNLRRTDKKP